MIVKNYSDKKMKKNLIIKNILVSAILTLGLVSCGSNLQGSKNYSDQSGSVNELSKRKIRKCQETADGIGCKSVKKNIETGETISETDCTYQARYEYLKACLAQMEEFSDAEFDFEEVEVELPEGSTQILE